MQTLLIAVGAFVGYLIAYRTYGRWLARKIFNLDPSALVPAEELQDDVDYVPTKRGVIFGHHFTSIAGTGPIVGPAIAVFWGWLPALLWVLFGSIFVGAVHDFGSLVVSLRNRGQTVGEVAGRLINRRARLLFLLILFFALTIVLAIFGLVIAVIFAVYPESVLSVWIALPIAIAIGFWTHKRGHSLLGPSLIALGLLYAAVFVGAYAMPITLSPSLGNPVVVWTMLLLVYCFVASVLPVWTLLQPRDYINSHQLLVAMGLLVIGLVVAGVTGDAQLSAAPAVADPSNLPAGALPIWPFLFTTIACGACSGFHCLVSSGTSSKQIANERDAQAVGYGAMLLEGGLAVVVILACTAGVGMGKYDRADTGAYVQAVGADEQPVTGAAAWKTRYASSGKWSDFNLKAKIGAFIEGGGNFLAALGIPLRLGIAIIAVLVASFAATTLDTATRLQRYVIQEIGGSLGVKPLTNKYVATGTAVFFGGAMALIPGPTGPGSGGLILWPLFGATNQLLAGLAFLVITFYLWRRGKPVWFLILPMLLMMVMPAWALGWQMFNPQTGWWTTGSWLLFGIGFATMLLQVWMIIEAVLLWPKVRGVMEEPLPPLPAAVSS